MQKLDLFQPVDLPSELDLLTKNDLFSLHQAVFGHGMRDYHEQVTRLWSPDPDISVTVSIHDDNRTMVIIAHKAATAGSHIVRLVEVDGFHSAMVLWDKRVAVDQIRSFTKKAEEIRQLMGKELLNFPKHAVKELFRKTGTALPIFHGGPTAEEFMQSFDHPEELTVWDNGFGNRVVVSKRDIPYFELRKQKVIEVLQGEGIDITDPEQLKNLSSEKILEMRKKISAIMWQ